MRRLNRERENSRGIIVGNGSADSGSDDSSNYGGCKYGRSS